MDALDRRLLGAIQSGFPLESRPYALLGESLGLTEAETLARVRALRAKGIIRRMGANFQSSELGFYSTLCAAAVPEDRREAFIALVNQRPGVTHNYLRQHAYNIWFTLIAPSREEALAEIADMESASGLPVLNLPAEKLYKIKVDFDMEE
ncbi:MAG: AsnC family transcriptional regulator [Deltaproteobacteria bacterium]|nr:AsnC family transcriptional regulator [Deltaproteobacteria bacterium]